MSARRNVATLVIVLAVAGALAVSARADSTGGSAAPGPGLNVPPAALLGQSIRARGSVEPSTTVAVQRLDSSGWVTIARTVADRRGHFESRWRPNHAGRFLLRVVPEGEAAVAQATAPPTAQVTVYRPATATWYGPGFYGRRTACGIRLRRELLGVAHRSLPCGTPIAIDYQGRSLVVPVIDRGPYGVAGADWDLTQATAFALGMTETATVGALRLKPEPAT
jgi:hypothetical protein